MSSAFNKKYFFINFNNTNIYLIIEFKNLIQYLNNLQCLFY